MTETNPKSDMPLQLYLLLAELTTGSTVLFGVGVNAPSYDEGLELLLEVMNKENGQRFIPAINMQYLNTLQYVTCPLCDTVSPLGQGGCVNPDCQADFTEPGVRAAIQAEPKRILAKVKHSFKALLDGSENKIMLRPEHLMCYDLVSPDSPSYKKWKAVAEQSIAAMQAMRSSIDIPTPGEVAAVTRDKQQGNIIQP